MEEGTWGNFWKRALEDIFGKGHCKIFLNSNSGWNLWKEEIFGGRHLVSSLKRAIVFFVCYKFCDSCFLHTIHLRYKSDDELIGLLTRKVVDVNQT